VAEPSETVMWRDQASFRWSIDYAARVTLASIGVQAGPVATLVGFRLADGGRIEVSVEPATHMSAPDTFTHVFTEREAELADAVRRFDGPEDDEESWASERAKQALRIVSICNALVHRNSHHVFYGGFPGRVNGWEVYPVISVVRSRWLSYPTIEIPARITADIGARSLQHTLVGVLLDQAGRAMRGQDPPQEVGGFISRFTDDLRRRAADDFVSQLLRDPEDYAQTGFELNNALDSVSAQPYEGRTGVGTIVVAPPNHPGIERIVTFGRHVPITDARPLRKALEMTGPDLHLLVTDNTAWGLGRVNLTERPTSSPALTIKVVGRGAWQLEAGGVPLMRMQDRMPTLPDERIARTTFVDTVHRVLGPTADADSLWSMAEVAAEQQHGTMLVIHRDAVSESGRLAAQATPIHPSPLTEQTLASMSSIDGAILLDPQGCCHAVGVILDGVAVANHGDPSRGARFNSAVRYHQSMPHNTCVIVVVSEDGMINLLPKLRRQVDRDSVEQALRDLDWGLFNQVAIVDLIALDRRVQSLAFYLSEEQADRVNALRAAIAELPEYQGSAEHRFDTKPLARDPELDDSYFFDGDDRDDEGVM